MLCSLIKKDLRIMYRSKIYTAFEILIVMIMFIAVGIFGVKIANKMQSQNSIDRFSGTARYPIVFEKIKQTYENLSQIRDPYSEERYIGISPDVDFNETNPVFDINEKIRFDVTLLFDKRYHINGAWSDKKYVDENTDAMYKAVYKTAPLNVVEPYGTRFYESSRMIRDLHQFNEKNVAIDLFVFKPFQFFVILVVINIVRNILHEKATFKNYLVSMGLPIHTYYLSHVLFNFVKCLIIFTPGLIFVSFALESNHVMIYMFISCFLFLLPTISFAFLIANCFKTQKSAILSCLFIWSVLNIAPDILIGGDFDKLNSYALVLPSTLLFTFNMFYISKTLTVMEQFGDTSCWAISNRVLPLYAFWILLILNAALMFGLAVLLDGSVGKWTPWGWWKKKRALSNLHNENNTDNERGSSNTTSPLLAQQDTSVRRKLESDIDISDVVKIYEETGEMAVKGLTMRAIRGQVAVLLGHNGCGKSTTFSMISGMIKPTAGTIQVAGVDVVSNLTEARQKIGLCPQYNPLIDKLTVWEHLEIVHDLKKAESNFETEAIELLESIELMDERDELSKNLSGGMKRKLCMLMALIGESSVVLLDEPTAGMDSTARVDVQTMLRKCKHNRTILLTTHNMDEADKLADWVYVMSEGKIQASGSSQFLKSKFGGGWLVTVVVEEPEKCKAVLLEMCQKFEASSKIKDVRGQMIEFSIPSEDKSKIIELLKCLETISEKNFDSELLKDLKVRNINISSIGVSLNSLEQVFINVIEQCEKDAKKYRNEDEKRETLRKVIATKREDQISLGILSQFVGLSLKRFLYFRRNLTLNITNLLIPMIILIGFLLSYNSEVQQNIRTEFQLDINSIPKYSIVVIQTDSIEGSEWIKQYFSKNPDLKIRVILDNTSIEDIFKNEQFFRRISTLVTVKNQGKNVTGIILPSTFVQAEPVGAYLLVNLQKEPVGEWEYHFNRIIFGTGNMTQKFGSLILVSMIAVFIIYSIIQSGFLHVEERVSKFKRLQFLTEMSPFIYWFSIYFWEFLIFTAQTAILLVTLVIFGDISAITFVKLLLTCCLAWIAMAPVIFIFSFIVDSTSKIVILAMVFCFILPFIKYMFDYFALDSFDPQEKMRFLFPIQPFITLITRLFYLNDENDQVMLELSQLLYHMVEDLGGSGIDYSQIIVNETINLAIFAVISNCSLFVISFRISRQIWNKIWHSKHFAEPKCQLTIEPCPAVLKEQEDIENETINSDNSKVVINNLVKRFGSFTAVNGLFLGVRNDECFGLLGVNGAGKTTTIEILTAEKLACSGEAVIDGRNVRKSVKVGFCPQFDAILPELTGREVLEILARLQNFKNPSEVVSDLIDCVGMRGNAGKPIKLCSGGQKRKISMACAILSRGKLCILDEPTAGVDPKARRDLWDIVGGIRGDGNLGGGGSVETTTVTGRPSGSEISNSFLLTSHSMEECEALCTRIGILRKGDLIALASCQELKSTYGNTFTLTICLKLSDVSKADEKKEIVKKVREKFLATLLSDENDEVANDLVFEVPRKKTDKWSTKMNEVKELADEMEIKDYYLVQSSLEDVFIKMNSQNIEKMDPEDNV